MPLHGSTRKRHCSGHWRGLPLPPSLRPAEIPRGASHKMAWQRIHTHPAQKPMDNSPNKALIFTPLPSQAWFVYWFLKTFHTGLSPFIFHADNSSKRREEVIKEFTKIKSPA